MRGAAVWALTWIVVGAVVFQQYVIWTSGAPWWMISLFCGAACLINSLIAYLFVTITARLLRCR